jgi:catechol 2,3-dioxygenase
VDHRDTPGLVEIGFHVRDDADLDAFQQKLILAGVMVEAAEANSVLQGLGKSIAFIVPAGPRVRLFSAMHLLGYVTGYEGPDWVAPKGLRNTAAPLNINHVAFTSPDPARASAFFSDVLGFVMSEKVVDEAGKTISSLLFRMAKNVGGQELAIYPGKDVKLHHVAFTKEDASDVMADGYYLRSDGVTMDLLGPLRQPYGNTFSLHFHDRTGIRLELCAGGRMIEVHPEVQPVVWSKDNLREALSYYDDMLVPEEFFLPCV